MGLSRNLDAIFKDLDDKAAGIITYLSSGAGLVTFSSLVATSAGAISPWVALSMVPAVALALAAIFCAAKARQPNFTFGMPPVSKAIDYAHYFHKEPRDGQRPKDAFLAQWNLQCVQMGPVVRRKAEWVMRATWLFFGAVVCLTIPLLVGVSIRLANPAPPALTVINQPALHQ